jgi:hypothetical protein
MAAPEDTITIVNVKQKIKELIEFECKVYTENPLYQDALEDVSYDKLLLQCKILFNNLHNGNEQTVFNRIINDTKIIQFLYDKLPPNIKKTFDLIKKQEYLEVYYPRFLVCYYMCE